MEGVHYILVVPILSPALAIQYPDGALVTYEEWRWVLGQP